MSRSANPFMRHHIETAQARTLLKVGPIHQNALRGVLSRRQNGFEEEAPLVNRFEEDETSATCSGGTSSNTNHQHTNSNINSHDHTNSHYTNSHHTNSHYTNSHTNRATKRIISRPVVNRGVYNNDRGGNDRGRVYDNQFNQVPDKYAQNLDELYERKSDFSKEFFEERGKHVIIDYHVILNLKGTKGILLGGAFLQGLFIEVFCRIPAIKEHFGELLHFCRLP